MVRFTRALRPTNVLRRSQRALGVQNYSVEHYERVLRGSKEIFGRPEKAPLALKRLLGDLEGPCELLKSKRIQMSKEMITQPPENNMYTIFKMNTDLLLHTKKLVFSLSKKSNSIFHFWNGILRTFMEFKGPVFFLNTYFLII